MQRTRFLVVWFCGAIVILMGVLHAQTSTTGRVTGAVKDATGAVVPGTKVALTSSDGTTRDVSTGGDGRYVFSLVPSGTYKVEASKSGFGTAVVDNVVVRITETTVTDMRLEVAAAKTVVEVSSEPPMVETESAARGDVIGSTAIRQLPLATRNFQQLLTLTPGTSGSVPNSSDLGRGDETVSVNGQRMLSNSMVINGVDASSIGTGSTPNLAVPATDAIQEFIVSTNLYDASMGRNAGSVVSAVTKSGTNELHGNAYEFFRNSVLNANNFFLNRAGVPRPAYQRNQFGGTLGGPIVKDRAWFFVSYQGTREKNGTSLTNSIGTVFVPGNLTNDRSTAALDALAASYGLPGIDPTAMTLLQSQLPNGSYVIPSAPHPTSSNVPVATPVVGLSYFKEDQFNTNLDVQLTSKDRLSGKFFWADNPETQALYNAFGLGNALPTPGFGANIDFNQRVLSIEETHVFGRNVVNDFRFGYSPITTSSTPQEPFTSAQLGIASPLSSEFPGMPEISVANYFDLGASPFADNTAKEGTYTAADTVSWQKGKHSLKFGIDYKHDELQESFNLYTRGQIFFLGFSGDPFKDFLGGFFGLTGLSIMGSGVPDRDILTHDLSGFVTDTWRATSRLTLTLGLRYEYFAPFTEAEGRFVAIDPTGIATTPIPVPGAGVAITGGFVQSGNATNPLPGIPKISDGLTPPDKNNFGPRFGFAWQPNGTGRTVIRGGYGVYYDRPNSRIVNNQLLDFPYYTLAQAFTTPISNPFVQVPPPSSFPLTFNNPALFPFGGPPAFLPAAVAGGLAVVSANGVYPDINNFRTPYIQQYSFGVQQQFAKTWMLDLAYVGDVGHKMLQLQDLNQPIAPIAGAPGPYSLGLSGLVVQGFGVHVMQSTGNASYNSLQASLNKQFSHGLQFLAAYTWSHSIDTYSGDPSGTSDVTVVPGNQYILNNRGNSDFDRRQRFVFSGLYEIPNAYHGKSGFVNQVTNGWQVATIVTVQTGTPFSVLTNDTAFVQARADAVPGCNPTLTSSVASRLTEYFNTSCFTPATAVGDFGDTGRNILRGPAQLNTDFSVMKTFPVTERTQIQFRTEFFNIFNNVNFANPVNVLASPNVGQIVSTSTGPRVIQFALKVNF